MAQAPLPSGVAQKNTTGNEQIFIELANAYKMASTAYQQAASRSDSLLQAILSQNMLKEQLEALRNENTTLKQKLSACSLTPLSPPGPLPMGKVKEEKEIKNEKEEKEVGRVIFM